MDERRASSSYSAESVPTDLTPFSSSPPTTAPSTSANSIRRQSSLAIPSYMNYQNGAPAARNLVPIPHPASGNISSRSAVPRNGLLLIFIADEPYPTILDKIETLLANEAFSHIALIGHSSFRAELETFKNGILSILGRLKREPRLKLHLQTGWTDETIEASVQEAIRQHGSPIEAVLATPQYSRRTSRPRHMFHVTRHELVDIWEQSLYFLLAIVNSTLPKFNTQGSRHGFFWLVEDPSLLSVGIVTKVACNALVKEAIRAFADRNVVIDYAEIVLAPSPQPAASLNSATDATELGDNPIDLWSEWSKQQDIEDNV